MVVVIIFRGSGAILNLTHPHFELIIHVCPASLQPHLINKEQQKGWMGKTSLSSVPLAVVREQTPSGTAETGQRRTAIPRRQEMRTWEPWKPPEWERRSARAEGEGGSPLPKAYTGHILLCPPER